jgi:hypothetical protein
MNIRQFSKDNRISIHGLSKLLGISEKRAYMLVNGEPPTPYEEIKIARLFKFTRYVLKPMDLEDNYKDQRIILASLKKTILKHVAKTSCMDTLDMVESYLEEVEIESMHLGLMYANNNEDDKVFELVRKRRKV